jgi:7,8-dihydropterin-6-yl-methyl-4-(beta-D-ribofuranosyl)aminobenzene 5'-phosphate synthase
MLDQLEITVLAENRVTNPKLYAEQGLSFHIASPEGNFLFDTGHHDAFIRNADQLGINLTQVDKIIFSHGHYDHTGGLFYYLQTLGEATIICHYNIFNRKFRVFEGGRLEVGIPYEESDLKKTGGDFIYKTQPFNLSENILSTGEVPRITDYETPDEVHQELVLESYITDVLNDDMGMVLKTSKGLIVLLGDSHSGPVNTVKYAMRLTGIQKVHAIIGGMNLIHASMEKIEKIGRGLMQINPQYLIPLHSTGFQAMNHFYHIFKKRLLLFNTGDRLTLKE